LLEHPDCQKGACIVPNLGSLAWGQQLKAIQERAAYDQLNNVTITRNSEGSAGFSFHDDGLWVSRITGDVSTMPHLKDIQVYDIIVAVNGVTIQDKGDYEREAKGIPTFELTICRFKCDATSTTFSWAFADTNPAAYHNPARWSSKQGWKATVNDILSNNQSFRRPVNIIKYSDGIKVKEYKAEYLKDLKQEHDATQVGARHYQFVDFMPRLFTV